MKSLVRGFNFWEMDLQPKEESINIEEITSSVANEIQECELDEDSSQVAVLIAGYIAKKISKKCKCEACLSLLLKIDSAGTKYLNLLSRGGLMTPSQYLSNHVCHCFAVLDLLRMF